MTVTFRAATDGGSSPSFNVEVTKPTGVVEGDVLLCLIVRDTGASGAVPSGWSLVETSGEFGPGLPGGSDVQVGRLYWKAAGPSEPSSYTFQFGTSELSEWVVLAYSGADTADPIDVLDSQPLDPGGTDIVAPSVTSTVEDGLLVCLWSGWTGAPSGTLTTPVSMTERVNVAFGRKAAADEAVGTGATGTRTATQGSGSNTEAVGFSAVLKVANDAPNAPIPATPADGSTIDLAATNRFSWSFSDPDAGDSQSKFDLRYKLTSSGTWTDVSDTTPNAFWDAAAATFTAGDWEWQVRTYDALGTVGPYCASQFFTAAEAPDPPTITDPINGATIASESDTITWSTPDQDAYQVRVVADDGAGSPDTGTVDSDTGEVTSTTTRTISLDFPDNGTTKHLQVRVKVDGLWSSWASIMVLVDYTEPATPTLTVTADTPTGAISVQAAHPTPTGDQPTVTYVDLYRRDVGDTGDGIRIATQLAPTATHEDWRIGSGQQVEYRAKAVGDNGTSAFSAWTD